MSHQTNAPNLTCQRTEPCTDLDVMFFKQFHSDCSFVDTPFIDLHRHAAETCNGIDQEARVGAFEE